MSFWNRFDKPLENPSSPPREEPAPAPAAKPAEPSLAGPVTAATSATPAPRAEAAPPPAPASTPIPSADLRLGRGVRLEGKLTFSGTVRIDATFQGEIVTDGVLVVGEGAKVDAKISCGTIVVEGEVNGDITASAAVELRPAARVRGDVETPSLAVDRGAFFEGSSKRPQAAASYSDRRSGKAAAASAPSAH